MPGPNITSSSSSSSSSSSLQSNDVLDSPRFVEESLDPQRGKSNTTNIGLGEHCKSDRPTPIGKEPVGKISKLGGVDIYVSKPPKSLSDQAKFLLFLTGATGIHSVNNQIQADVFAREGFFVVLPDMFLDDPLPGTATYDEEKDPSIIEKMKLRLAETAKSFLIDMWLARQTPQKVIPLLMNVIEDAKEKFSREIENGGGIYCVGYCFGGRMTLLLAGERPDRFPTIPWVQKAQDEESNPVKTGPYIKVGAICHATLVAKEDFISIKSPLSFVCVQDDQLFPEDVKQYGEQSLKYDQIPCEFKTYSKVPHGFGIIGEYEDTNIKVAQAKAFEQILSWLQQY